LYICKGAESQEEHAGTIGFVGREKTSEIQTYLYLQDMNMFWRGRKWALMQTVSDTSFHVHQTYFISKKRSKGRDLRAGREVQWRGREDVIENAKINAHDIRGYAHERILNAKIGV
jgi:hypothetical protein